MTRSKTLETAAALALTLALAGCNASVAPAGSALVEGEVTASGQRLSIVAMLSPEALEAAASAREAWSIRAPGEPISWWIDVTFTNGLETRSATIDGPLYDERGVLTPAGERLRETLADIDPTVLHELERLADVEPPEGATPLAWSSLTHDIDSVLRSTYTPRIVDVDVRPTCLPDEPISDCLRR